MVYQLTVQCYLLANWNLARKLKGNRICMYPVLSQLAASFFWRSVRSYDGFHNRGIRECRYIAEVTFLIRSDLAKHPAHDLTRASLWERVNEEKEVWDRVFRNCWRYAFLESVFHVLGRMGGEFGLKGSGGPILKRKESRRNTQDSTDKNATE